jgi:hypothetical protein
MSGREHEGGRSTVPCRYCTVEHVCCGAAWVSDVRLAMRISVIYSRFSLIALFGALDPATDRPMSPGTIAVPAAVLPRRCAATMA